MSRDIMRSFVWSPWLNRVKTKTKNVRVQLIELVGGWTNLFEKYARQIGSRDENKKYVKPPPSYSYSPLITG